MEIIQQLVNGLDKGTAYALIALGLSLIFGTLGCGELRPRCFVHDRHVCRRTIQQVLNIPVEDPTQVVKDFLGNETPVVLPLAEKVFGPDMGAAVLNNGSGFRCWYPYR